MRYLLEKYVAAVEIPFTDREKGVLRLEFQNAATRQLVWPEDILDALAVHSEQETEAVKVLERIQIDEPGILVDLKDVVEQKPFRFAVKPQIS